jgi:hypothetical protein
MKKNLFLLLLICGQIGSIMAQDAQVPDFKNEPMMVKKDGSLGRLEKTTGEARSKGAAGPFSYGYGASSAYTNDYITFQQAKSPVRFGTDAKFIVKLTDAETDPDAVFYLTKAIIHKNTREIYTHKAGGKSLKDSYVQIDWEKVSPGVYRIIPKGLTPGTEYGFVSTAGGAGHTLVFLFGTN